MRSIYTQSWIQDWYREETCKQKTDGFLHVNKEQKIQMQLTWMHRVLLGTSKKVLKKHQNTVYWSTTRFQLIVSRTLSPWNLESSHTRKYMRHLFLQRFPSKANWVKELGSEVAGGGKDSQQTQPKTKNPIVRTERLVYEQPPGCSHGART